MYANTFKTYRKTLQHYINIRSLMLQMDYISSMYEYIELFLIMRVVKSRRATINKS